jgi:hypothetical protein
LRRTWRTAQTVGRLVKGGSASVVGGDGDDGRYR